MSRGNYQNDLLIRVLNGEKTSRPPVWMMRQAGRYLPDYMRLREKYSFFERCETPELAAQITVMPIDQIGVDAAIIFSDILVIPRAMGMEVQLEDGKGPLLPHPVKNEGDVNLLIIPDVKDSLHFVAESLKLTKLALAGRVPLIGFAGAPWTLLCYMVQGKGTKTFDEAKAFCYRQPQLAHRLLQMITDTTLSYLKMQAESGADCLQIFDSWGGLLSPQDFELFSLPYLQQIVKGLQNICPSIVFAKGAWYALKSLGISGASALGVDWCISPQDARIFSGSSVTLQGNFDPAKLLATIPEIKKEVKAMIRAFGPERYIANLGHGILPHVPVDHARAFVDTVKEY
ncbi:MAG: uroporphyrinogen decarboxylase [Chitinophagaceae bacterium]